MVEAFQHSAQAQIIGTEVMAPLADAVGLVYDEERGRVLLKPRHGFRTAQLFGSEEQVFQLVLLEALESSAPGGDPLMGVDDRGGRQVAAFYGIQLVPLQSDQGGDD